MHLGSSPNFTGLPTKIWLPCSLTSCHTLPSFRVGALLMVLTVPCSCHHSSPPPGLFPPPAQVCPAPSADYFILTLRWRPQMPHVRRSRPDHTRLRQIPLDMAIRPCHVPSKVPIAFLHTSLCMCLFDDAVNVYISYQTVFVLLTVKSSTKHTHCS